MTNRKLLIENIFSVSIGLTACSMRRGRTTGVGQSQSNLSEQTRQLKIICKLIGLFILSVL